MSFISYAQNLEDVMLYRALRDVKHGFYVDVGANSPDQHSVTRALYERGWRGINIEPVPAFHEQLVAARPGDINLPIAIGDRAGLVNFYDIPDTGLSTVDQEVARQHGLSGYRIIERQVPVETLDQVFAAQGVDLVHFLKIDVEGHEIAVLRGLSLKDVRPWIIVVEATAPLSQDQNHLNWDSLLTGRGYSFVYFDGLNRFYVAEEKAELVPQFESPPNIFDDWMRAHDWAAHELVGNLSRHITAEQEAWTTERNRMKSESATLQHRIAELGAVNRSLENYVSDLHLSVSWRITAPMRYLKRVLTDPTKIQPWKFSRLHLVRLARRVARWAAERPVLRRAAMPILLRNPILGNKARALLTRELPILVPASARGLPLPALASPDLRCGADPLVSRSLSPAECTIEAAVQRALARAR